MSAASAVARQTPQGVLIEAGTTSAHLEVTCPDCRQFPAPTEREVVAESSDDQRCEDTALMNEPLLRALSCLDEAAMALNQNQLERFCSVLQDTSAILDALVVRVVPPGSDALPQANPAPATATTQTTPELAWPRASAAAA